MRLSRSKRLKAKGIKTAMRNENTGEIYLPENELEERFHPAIYERLEEEGTVTSEENFDTGFVLPNGEYVSRKDWFDKYKGGGEIC